MKFTKIVLWIVGVVLVVIAPIQLYRIHRAFGTITSGAVLFLILPAILITGMAFIVKKWPTNKMLEALSVVALGLTLLWYIPLTFGIEAWISAEPVSDIGKYKKILTKWKQSAPDIVSHFPESIPPEAQDVDFYFSPGFLQADSEIQLRFKTTPKNIEEY